MKFLDYISDDDNKARDPVVSGSHFAETLATGIIVDENVADPREGFEKVIQALFAYGLSLPIAFELYEEGDELVVEMTDNLYLYIIYAEENGLYDFYAELVDEDGLEEILQDDEEEPE